MESRYSWRERSLTYKHVRYDREEGGGLGMEPERFAPFLGDEATFKKREADMAKRLVFSYNYKFYCFVWFVLFCAYISSNLMVDTP